MADLTGKTIANTYKDLLQTGTSGTGLPSDTPVNIQDGEGKSSGLKLSQNQIDLTGTVKIKGTELTANVSALNAVADFTAVSGFATGNGAGTIVGRTFSASTGISITNADGISGRPTFSLAESGVTSGTYSGQIGLFDVDNTGRITAVNTTNTVSVENVNTVNLSATTANFSGNVSVGGTLTMSGAISPSSVSTTGDINGVNFNASGDISATALNVGGTVSAVDYYGDGSNLTGIVATSATNASYAASAGEAQTAVSASHAVSADFAASANNATFASTATNASFAASATNATNATSAVFASSATNATNAINVDYGGVVETSTANIGSVSASNIFVDGNVSVGGTFDVSGAVSIGGGLFVVGDVSAGNIHAGGIIYGNGAGLFNVPSESGGTVNFVKAGDGLHVLIDNTTTTNPISASGTVALDFDQTFGAVSASSLAISSSASFADSAVLNFGNSDDLTIQHNGTHSVIKEAGTGDLYIQSNRIRLANTGASDMLTLADGQDAEFPFGVQVSGTVSATSFVGPTITSINSAIAGVSSTLATSINNTNSNVTALSATMATSIANHLPLAGGTMTGAITLSGNPSANLEAATKQYVDNLTNAAIHFHDAVRVESPDSAGSLNATYDNGTAGVGATLTNAGTQAALVIDGVTLNTSDRVLIYNQTDATQNGVYTVTDTGSASTNWVLTRATDADSYEPNDNNGLDGGSYFYVEEGNTGAGEAYVCNNVGTITFGTTDITFVQFSSALVYTAGSGININSSRVVSTSGVPTDADLTALSATMATSIANVSSTMATSINNTNTNLTALSATMATSIGNTNTNLTALSATLATSISNYMPLAGGTFTGDVSFGDNDKAQFGAGNDLQIYHDGSNSIISDEGAGNLYLQSDGTSIRLRRASDGTQMLRAEPSDGSVRLYYGGTQKFITKSDGVDITGELQADSLDIDGAADIAGTVTVNTDVVTQATALKLNGTSFADTEKLSLDFSRGGNEGVRLSLEPDGGQTVGDFVVETGTFGSTTDRLRVEGNGDISFYADDGTTQGLFWDASTQRLGLGTTSPNSRLNLKLSSRGSSDFRITDADTSNDVLRAGSQADGDGLLQLRTVAGQGNVLFDASGVSYINGGNVGIGTASPSDKLEVNGNARLNPTSNPVLRFAENGTVRGLITSSSTIGLSLEAQSTLPFKVNTNGSERMRIDSSGSVGIGSTSPNADLHIAASNQSTGSRGNLYIATTDAYAADKGGQITFGGRYFDNPADTFFGSIAGRKENANASNVQGYLSFATRATAGNEERMRIDSSGNVGIGDTTPSYKLDVAGDINFTGTLRQNGTEFSGGGGLFKGENGEVGSSAGDIFRVHEQTLNTNVTIDSDENGLCAGPLTIASGVTLTVNGNLSIV